MAEFALQNSVVVPNKGGVNGTLFKKNNRSEPGTLVRDLRVILLFLKKIMRKRQMILGFRVVLFNKPSKQIQSSFFLTP